MREGGVRYLLAKIDSLESQNSQLRRQIRQRQNFNKKLCSENRKRRLKNNELVSLDHDRLLQIKNIKGHQQEYRKMAVNLRKTLKDSEQKLQQYQDQILILKTQITKHKKESQGYQVLVHNLKKQIENKTDEFERFMILQNEIAKKKSQKTNQGDEQEQIFKLVCENQELQMRLKDVQKLVNNLRNQLQLASAKNESLKFEVQNNQEIIKILRAEFESELNQAANKQNHKNPLVKGTSAQSLIIVQTKKASNISLQKYGTKLSKRQQGYYYEIQHLLYSQNSLENLTFNPLTIYLCQPISLSKNNTYYSRIKLTAEGQIHFGISNSCFSLQQAMTIRNVLYYNNCSGLIVVDKQGKIIDQYTTFNDTLTLSITITQPTAKLKLFRNDKIIYQCGVPELLMRGQYLYPFIKLYQFMSIEMQ